MHYRNISIQNVEYHYNSNYGSIHFYIVSNAHVLPGFVSTNVTLQTGNYNFDFILFLVRLYLQGVYSKAQSQLRMKLVLGFGSYFTLRIVIPM